MMAAVAEPPPMTTRALLLALAFALGVSFFLWDTIAVYPFKLLVTLMHESGHAIAAKLVGGDVVSLTISPGEGGLTLSRFEPTRFHRLIVSSAGYVGSSLAGALLLIAAGRMRSGRFILGFLVAWVALVALVWVPLVPPALEGASVEHSGYARSDGLFTLGFILGIGALMVVLAWKAPVGVRRAFIVWVAGLSCLAALQDIKTLFVGSPAAIRASDAGALSAVIPLPAAVWATVWMLVSLAAMGIGIRSIVKRRQRTIAKAA